MIKSTTKTVNFNNQQIRFDYRWLVLFFLGGYFLCLLASHLILGSYKNLLWFSGVPAINIFSDLRILISGIEIYHAGNNPYLTPHNMENIPGTYNYPILWHIFYYVPFFRMKYFIYAGIILLLSFFTTVFIYIKRLNLFEGLYYSVILTSPAVMLGVERGNCDIIIFLILVVSIYALSYSKYFSYFLLLLASMLKLYPIFGMSYIINHYNSKRRVILTGIVLSILFSIYVFIIRDEISFISKITPRTFEFAYGMYVLPYYLGHKYPEYFSISPLKIVSIIAVSIMLVYLILSSYKRITVKADFENNTSFNLYMVGSFIFLGTFLIGNNYDYRLIFTLLTIPQLLWWAKHSNFLKKDAYCILILLIFLLWNSFYVRAFNRFDGLSRYQVFGALFEEISSWVIFYLFLKINIYLLFGWYRQNLKNKSPSI